MSDETRGYSRDEVVAEVKSYYEHLVTLYMDEDVVLYPPEGGWPSITKESLAWLNKTDTVVDLLRHLPYVRREKKDDRGLHIYDDTSAVDYRGSWYEYAASVQDPTLIAPWEDHTSLPEHVITFATTSGGRNGCYILIDTEEGTATLCDFQEGPLQLSLSERQLQKCDEAWRYHDAYAIPEFFAKLKEDFRDLRMLPADRATVIITRGHQGYIYEKLAPVLKENGWGTPAWDKAASIDKVAKAWQDLLSG